MNMRLFIFLSELLGHKIYDSENKYIGRLSDISMRLTDEVFPRAENIIIKRGIIFKEWGSVPYSQVSETGFPVKLKVRLDAVKFKKERIQSDFSLCKHILDQQVVDTQGQKVVRVNDVHLLNVDNQLYLAHVDIGLKGIFRRLEWIHFIDFLVKIFSPKAHYLTEESLISWKNTQVLAIGRRTNVLQSSMARQKLSKIPPTQLAEIMEDLDIFEKISLFKSFAVDKQRKIFTDMSPQEKESILDQLEDKEASELIENIPADEATDLLLKIPKEKRTKLMSFMHTKTSKELKKLLGFDEDSAGGLMTTEYLTLGPNSLVKDAIQKIKDNVDYPGNLFFIYIVDDEHKLVNSTSFKRFINEDPQAPLINTCFPLKVFVRTDDTVEEVALLLEKYKISSIPVVDEKDVLQGVITIDDVMEKLISLAWTKYEGQL